MPTIIDVFSKFIWLGPLNKKLDKKLKTHFFKIFEERNSTKMWVDKGRELYNKDVRKLVELYSTKNEEKSRVIDRFNRTIIDNIFKYFTAHSTRKYIDVFDKFVDQYDNSVHSSIKMSAVEASQKKN